MPVVRVSASGRPLPTAPARGALDGTRQNLPRVVLSHPQGPLVSSGAGPAWRPSSRTSSGVHNSSTSQMMDVDLPVVRRGGRSRAPGAPLEPRPLCPPQHRLLPSSSQHISIAGASMPVIRSGPRPAAAKPKLPHRSILVASSQDEPRGRPLPSVLEGLSAVKLPVVKIRRATPRRGRAGRRQPTFEDTPSLADVCGRLKPAARAPVVSNVAERQSATVTHKAQEAQEHR